MRKLLILLVLAGFLCACGQSGRLWLPKYQRDTRSGWYNVEDY